MQQQGTGRSDANALLQRVHEGMEVYDLEDEKLGEVDQVYFGEVSTTADEFGMGSATEGSTYTGTTGDSLLHDLAEVFDADEDLPETVRGRLLRQGFIRIEGGLFGSDRYIMPDQIASVSKDAVRLSVHRDNLIKR
jgi:hypothetical protein